MEIKVGAVTLEGVPGGDVTLHGPDVFAEERGAYGCAVTLSAGEVQRLAEALQAFAVARSSSASLASGATRRPSTPHVFVECDAVPRGCVLVEGAPVHCARGTLHCCEAHA